MFNLQQQQSCQEQTLEGSAELSQKKPQLTDPNPDQLTNGHVEVSQQQVNNGPRKIDLKRASHRVIGATQPAVETTTPDGQPVKRKRGRPPKIANQQNNNVARATPVSDDSIIQSQSQEELIGERKHPPQTRKYTEGSIKPFLTNLLNSREDEKNLQLQNQQSMDLQPQEDPEQPRNCKQSKTNDSFQNQQANGTLQDSLDDNPEDSHSLKFKSQQGDNHSGVSSLDRSDSLRKNGDGGKGSKDERNSLDQDSEFANKKSLKHANYDDNEFLAGNMHAQKPSKVNPGHHGQSMEYFDPSSPQLHISYEAEESKLLQSHADRKPGIGAHQSSAVQNCVKQEDPCYQMRLDERISGDSLDQDHKDYDYEGSQILVENLPLLGQVPLVFYLPQGTDQEHIDLILSNGGQVSNIVECFTLQLSMIPTKGGQGFEQGFSKKQPNPKSYFHGNIYSYQWIRDSIDNNDVMTKDQYLLMTIPYPQSLSSANANIKKQSGLSGQRTRFTMRELIKIFNVTEDYPSKKNKNQVYWQRFIKQGFFPGRSVNSVNAQWQRFCHYDTVEQALEKALQLGMPYSTAFNTLPSSVDCSILTMKSESLLTGKINNNNSSCSPTTKVKSEGQTLIKNFQSHNVHFQHFMKQKGGVVHPQLKKESADSRTLRSGIKQETIQPTSGSIAQVSNSRRLESQFQEPSILSRKHKKYSKKFKQEVGVSPSSQPSVANNNILHEHLDDDDMLKHQHFNSFSKLNHMPSQSRRVSADSTLNNMEHHHSLHQFGAQTSRTINIDHHS